MPSIPLGVLSGEDSEVDTELLLRERKRAGDNSVCAGVETAEAMRAADAAMYAAKRTQSSFQRYVPDLDGKFETT